MTVIENLLSDISRLGIKLWLEYSDSTQAPRLKCRAPEGALNPALRDQLQQHKIAIIETLQQWEKYNNQAVETIVKVPREGNYSLSFAQERLWFINQLNPGDTNYNVVHNFQISGILNVSILEQSVNEIIRRHEVLRTTFSIKKGSPIQAIAPSLNLILSVVDLQSLPSQEQLTQTEQFIQAENQYAFDLSQEILLRATVLHLSEPLHILLLTCHHIITDGWSTKVLLRELGSLYTAFLNDESSPLPELPIQYIDFAHWQRQCLSKERLANLVEYWRHQLAGAPPLLDLPTDHSRPPVQTFRGATQLFDFSKDLTQQIKELGYQAGTTLFMTLLTAFMVLLSRYSGQEDIIVGTPIAGRNHPALDSMIGFFVNTLVLRVDLSGNPSFRELMDRTRQVTLDAYSHQDLQFEKLVEELQPERNPGYNPLFQVMFVLQENEVDEWKFSDLTLTPLPTERVTAKFDLTLCLENRESGLRGKLEYSTDLFDQDTAARMIGHFQTLLAAIVRNPDQSICHLPLLSLEESYQLLVAWNQTQMDSLCDISVHSQVLTLLEQQVSQHPDAIAVQFQQQTLTYQALHDRANQLAHYLQSLGVGPEVVVGLCVERSIELVVGFLGILKAGGAYLPLDPTYPQERLTYMLADAQVSVLVTQPTLLTRLPSHPAKVVMLESDSAVFANQPVTAPTSAITAETLAYVIYTSGSTGRPKGVMVTHRGLSNLAATLIATFKVNPHSRVLQFTSLSFDVSISEILMVLSSGACLCLNPSESLLPSLDLVQLLQQQAITHLALPASALATLPLMPIPSLQVLIVGGEACPVPLMQEWAKGREFFNAYGPTEASVYTTIALCQPEDPIITLGRPIPNVNVYILDPYGQPVPIGIPGELYIGGIGLARGYLNRPDLTQATFAAMPHSLKRLHEDFGKALPANSLANRLYKTGDRVRYLADGRIEFLGRIDHQVKLRGFRIELGEISATLEQHPAIQTAIALLRPDQRGEQQLVAYAVLHSGSDQPSAPELRRFLRGLLPHYMVPMAIILLSEFPLTPNGKINRAALPAPDLQHLQQATFVPPRSPVEIVIANIIASALGLEQVGLQDDFFELGGHSLLATQVISRIRQSFGVEIPLITLFEQPRLIDLAQAVNSVQKKDFSPLPPIQPIDRNPLSDPKSFPLSFAQQRLWFLNRLEGVNTTSYNTGRTFQLTGNLNRPALQQSLQALIERHESLRTTFPIDRQGIPCQRINEPGTITLPVIELEAGAQEAEIKELIKVESQQPFDLTHNRLIRFKLLQSSPTDHILMVTIHHIICDGWSIGVFQQELLQLYQAFCQNQSSPLSPLQIQYADFACWQRQWLTDQVLEAELNYWKQQLEGAPPLLELPTDYPRPAVQTFQGGEVSFQVDASLSQNLKAFSQKAGVTLFMTLLTVFKILLSRYSRQTDIVVGAPIANRNQAEIEPLIGFFVNTLVLRSDLSGNPRFVELLRQVRQTTLEAYTHQDLPFEKLVEELQPKRRLDHHPIIQVMFALQNVPDADLELPDLEVKSLRSEVETTREFDLEVYLWEKPQGLVGSCIYRGDLFKVETIQRLFEQFQRLLQAVVIDSSQRIDELPLLTLAEQHQILTQWNQTQRDYPRNSCIHQLFEQQVERSGDAIALVFEDQQLTYQELDYQANQLAAYLRNWGVDPDVLVGVCLERSPDLIVAILAILKAGGAYVPLDPNYPSERLAFIAEDTQIPILITQTAFRAHLSDSQTCFLICLDEINLREFAAQQPTNRKEHDVQPDLKRTLTDTISPTLETQAGTSLSGKSITADNLAYVMYTSGSTGKPKGVAVSHRGVVRLVVNSNYVNITAADTFLQLASIAFDAATFEIWGALLNGATLVLAPASRSSLAEIAYLLQHHHITILWLTAGLFHQMVEEHLEAFSSVQQLLAGGDVLSVAHVQTVVEALPNTLVINGYGPTENTTFTCCYPVRDLDEIGTSIPIGSPISNTQVYLLDQTFHPVPVGVPGELYIGGDGLAREYLKRPDLTAERFIVNPFLSGKVIEKDEGRESKEPLQISTSDTLYRTGDLARYLPDGNIEFLGRVDHQVKIRGFRIELGEIEATIRQNSIVSQTVATVHRDATSHKSLIAYLVPDWRGQGIAALLAQAEQELLEDWQTLYEEIYSPSTSEPDETGLKSNLDFNIVGWNSSYTGQPIPAIEMREWVEHTVSRIQHYHPQSVLEIGCGTGLLLSRIAPHCKHYEGTDYSRAALAYNQNLQQSKTTLNHVIFHHKLAHDFEGIPKQKFDTVILNSVIQYFPSIHYLLQVLQGAIDVIIPGTPGRIFVGDIRSLPLLDKFHTMVQYLQADDSMLLQELTTRCQQSLQAEEELVIDPDFFVTLPHYFPEISHVEVQPKRGKHHNELTQFRYDVTLHLSMTQPRENVTIPWQDWQDDPDMLTQVRRVLLEERPESLGIRRIPNGRIQQALQVQQCLEQSSQEFKTVKHLRQHLMDVMGDGAHNNSSGVEPDMFWELAEELGYQVHLSWWEASSTGYYDVVFLRETVPKDQDVVSALQKVAFWQEHRSPLKLRQDYANIPLQSKLTYKLIPEIRQFLQNKLPEYMLPQHFVVLDHLPLTANGKVDRSALPVPDVMDVAREGAFVAPKTPTQELLAAIWREVLRIEQISLDDDFFKLGGHSLLATQVMSRIRHRLGVELPLQVMFEQPTLRDLTQAIETAQQGDLISFPAIQPVSRATLLPVSFAQQRLWFLTQLEGMSAGYNVPNAFKLEGVLNHTALEQSFQAIIHRHETLRTTFKADDTGTPYQYINEAGIFTLPVIELHSEHQERQVKDQIQAESHQPFDISQDQLIRAKLLCLSPTTHVLLVTIHHIVSDGWSLGVFIQELSQLYQAFCQGETSPLFPLTIQYADFAQWQRQWLAGQALTSHLDYWKQKLDGAPPLLEFPTDHPRPEVATFEGGIEWFWLDSSLTQQLKTLSQKAGVTLFMTLLAAFQVLLSRYTRKSDIVVGSPIANRKQVEVESLLGFFVNTLVLRSDLSNNPSFEALLAQVRQTTLEAYLHQDLPFEKLVETLQPERHLNHHPIVQVMFALQNALGDKLELFDLKVERLGVELKTIREFDFELDLFENPEGLAGRCTYNIGLFKAETIRRMLGHFQTLLQAIVVDSTQGIAELPLLTQAEQQLLVAWNQTQKDYPHDQCIHQLFEAQVERTSDAIAVIFEGQKLTYRELNERSNQLAHYLQQQGVGPEVLVGICVERSLEMVVGVLGILKAGGAYVPLDPTYPSDRIAYMMEDSEIGLLLTQQCLLKELPLHRPQIICLDVEDDVFAKYSTDTVHSKVHPTNLAYVIYTSGSTGQPKGVAITHHSVLNLDQGLLHAVYSSLTHSKENLCISINGSYAFDTSVKQILQLLHGHTLVIVPESDRYSGSTLLHYLKQYQIDVFDCTPMQFTWLIEAGLLSTDEVPLRAILVGGEPIASSTWLAVQSCETIHCFNLYGPTECTVDATICRLQSAHSAGTIGRPIVNTQVYLLDSHLQPVPIGIPGELYIGGAGLARGYLNRPELTATKFIANPFGAGRLYQTGDLARYLPDGSIEYLGRLDQQVKIRGFRIELGEITTVLSQHPDISQAVTIARESETRDRQLIAYVVAKDNVHVDPPVLRQYLQQSLPAYMLPSSFVSLAELPLMPNGKIDRKALPAPNVSDLQRQTTFVPASTSTQQLLVMVWADVLGVDQIGLYDNFFNLGGHSLLAVKVISRLQEALQISLPVQLLFTSKTLLELAQAIDRIRNSDQDISKLGTSFVDLEAEAILDPNIKPAKAQISRNPDHILLTGATGFVGIFLLHELLKQTSAKIYCLMRTGDPLQGWQRLHKLLKSFGLWHETYQSRVVVIKGDLSLPKFGLEESEYEQLSHQVESIYHSGAWVNSMYPYSFLSPVNVAGTQEIIKLACASRVKPLHHISTLGVFSAGSYSGQNLIFEDDPLIHGKGLKGGYSQSKWVAEKLVMAARNRGLPTSIYRLGRVFSHCQTGIMNMQDFLCIFLRGCIQFGKYPDSDQMVDRLTPVDYVSKAIVHLSLKGQLGKVFHINNPETVNLQTLFEWIKAFGYPLEAIPYSEWRTQFTQLEISQASNNSLYSLFPAFSPYNPPYTGKVLRFDYQNLTNGLAQSNIQLESINQAYLNLFLSFLIQENYLDAPARL
ncbi:non-ribosomal peptide synthetase [Moorena sp. SIO4A5]|uniref:non-ribosomal peptide synthetase n=1 Tax=Moorena sp. SIO4A5 TaxID=2607838 RepID=UPI0013C7AAB5|nr:non-ribosomal peptide synthetase [Moorena sp. SIO4A5]NEO20282.1 amino acid adenylation domain-containing protein [Moorena sp. SIO4A5]